MSDDEAGYPPPGIDGTWRDSCVGCLRGTDTGFALVGDAEWLVAGLMTVGVPAQQAQHMVELRFGCDPGKVPDGEVHLTVKLCARCAEASGGAAKGLIVVPIIPGTAVPTYARHQRR